MMKHICFKLSLLNIHGAVTLSLTPHAERGSPNVFISLNLPECRQFSDVIARRLSHQDVWMLRVLFWKLEPEVTLALSRCGLTTAVLEELREHSSLSPAHRTTAVGAGTQFTCSSTLTHTDPRRASEDSIAEEDFKPERIINVPAAAGAHRGAREEELFFFWPTVCDCFFPCLLSAAVSTGTEDGTATPLLRPVSERRCPAARQRWAQSGRRPSHPQTQTDRSQHPCASKVTMRILIDLCCLWEDMNCKTKYGSIWCFFPPFFCAHGIGSRF